MAADSIDVLLRSARYDHNWLLETVAVVMKIAACTEASKETSYPWILHWVYRELAHARRDAGERDKAMVSYARSLAAKQDDAVWEEMERLRPPTH